MKIGKFLKNIFLLALFPYFLISCSSRKTVVIWTDRAEVVSYVEYFNVVQDKAKAIVVYKENLASAFPPASDEKKPDVLISSFLKNSRIKKNFAPLEAVLGRFQVDTSLIYSPLLDFGKSDGKQYLLPLSFNLPAVIFDESKAPLVSETGLLEFSRLKETSVVFNEKNASGVYTKMGFAPSWNQEFLYEYVKSHGANIKEKGNAISWNEENLNKSVEDLKNWTSEKNTSTSSEQDFSFKYLYMPVRKQVLSGKCLFAYTTSDKFFSLPQEQTSEIDFKWLSNGGKICIEDEIVMLGVYRKSVNTRNAFDFIIWLFNEDTQKNLLERSRNMHLDITSFGICNGFSSLKSVNERILPSYYKNLLGNLPDESSILCPEPLPERWKSLKERVVIPCLSDSTKTDSDVQPKTMEELLSSWRKQFN